MFRFMYKEVILHFGVVSQVLSSTAVSREICLGSRPCKDHVTLHMAPMTPTSWGVSPPPKRPTLCRVAGGALNSILTNPSGGVWPVSDPEMLKQCVGAKDNVSATSSFIANAHYELYMFHTGEGDLPKKLLWPEGGPVLQTGPC